MEIAPARPGEILVTEYTRFLAWRVDWLAPRSADRRHVHLPESLTRDQAERIAADLNRETAGALGRYVVAGPSEPRMSLEERARRMMELETELEAHEVVFDAREAREAVRAAEALLVPGELEASEASGELEALVGLVLKVAVEVNGEERAGVRRQLRAAADELEELEDVEDVEDVVTWSRARFGEAAKHERPR